MSGKPKSQPPPSDKIVRYGFRMRRLRFETVDLFSEPANPAHSGRAEAMLKAYRQAHWKRTPWRLEPLDDIHNPWIDNESQETIRPGGNSAIQWALESFSTRKRYWLLSTAGVDGRVLPISGKLSRSQVSVVAEWIGGLMSYAGIAAVRRAGGKIEWELGPSHETSTAGDDVRGREKKRTRSKSGRRR